MEPTEFNIGVIKPVECAKEGFERIKDEFWLLLAIWLVGGIIGGITFAIAAGAMTCGTFYVYLKKIDGEPIKFDDLWKGMRWFVPGLVVMLFIVVPIIMVYALIYVPFVMAAAMGGNMNESELMAFVGTVLAIDLILVVIMVCIHTLLMFSFPLIVDRNLGAIKAMATSARAVLKNMSGVVGLILINFVLVLAGYLALCIGIYLVIPVIIAANVVAYRRVFPKLHDDRRFEPPPIGAYGGG